MSAIIVEDLYFDEVEVSTASATGVEIDNGHREGGIVKMHVDPNGFIGEAPDVMRYSPEQARELAAALIMAADEAELPVGQGKTVKADFSVADEPTKNSKFC